MQSIEKARVTEALTILATEGAKTLGSPEVIQLTKTFSVAAGSDCRDSQPQPALYWRRDAEYPPEAIPEGSKPYIMKPY